MIRRVIIILAAAVACIPLRSAAAGDSGNLLDFTPDEVRRILQHGPWPMPWSRDPSNRVSGKPAAIALGERLFFETRLSSGGALSCASCHAPEKNFADARKLGVGLEEGDRNTPSVLNVRLNRWFGWDGANDNLWAQSMRPLLDPRELAVDDRRVAELIRNDRDLACRYRRAFGARTAGGRRGGAGGRGQGARGLSGDAGERAHRRSTIFAMRSRAATARRLRVTPQARSADCAYS